MSAFQRVAPERHDDIDGVPSPAETRALVGHEAARTELEDAVRSQRLHHAWLLQGPLGAGKATLAFDFARRLLSAARDGELPDEPLENVSRQVEQGGHPGLVHIARPPAERGGGFRTQITVEEIRRLTHFFQTTAGGRWRIAIVDPADDMNRSAANALLKMLEEPPPRSVFLLTNHQPGRLLPTIRSRCRVLRLQPLPEAGVERILGLHVPDAGARERAAAASRAGGSARRALLMLLGGGLELAGEAERLYAAPPAWSAIQKLGEQLAMKGREAAFELVSEELFGLLARDAQDRQAAGHAGEAAALAAFWSSEQARWREGLAYNLDRKQLLVTFFHGLAQVRERDDRAA